MTQYRGAIKWALYMLALLAVGPLASAPLAALRDATGGHHATILVNTSPFSAAGAGLLLLLASGAMGLVAARLIGPRQGLVTAGLVLAWGAWQTASLDALMRAARDGSVVGPLALEGGVLGVLGLGLGALVWVVGGGTRGPGPTAGGAGPSAATARGRAGSGPLGGVVAALRSGLVDGGAPLGVLAGVVTGGLVVWLVAQEPLKGQCLAAAVLAGIAAGGFGRAVSAKSGPPSPVGGLASLAILAVVGPISAMVMNGGGSSLVSAAIQGRAFPLTMPMPLDWLAGAFWGVPIGLSWADSMVDKPESKVA